ncbi:hypothetical protein KKG83_07505 [Candidatus Micrarchaeota archaeon]|nr:hypothetical protein [Candidatus Micrarchaeota archaeon]
MEKAGYKIVITRHAFRRALQRRIHPDLVEATFLSGKMKKFSKNRMKFEKKFKKFTLVCVDEIIGNMVKIVTIEKRR